MNINIYVSGLKVNEIGLKYPKATKKHEKFLLTDCYCSRFIQTNPLECKEAQTRSHCSTQTK